MYDLFTCICLTLIYRSYGIIRPGHPSFALPYPQSLLSMQQCFCSGQARRGKRDDWGASQWWYDGLKLLSPYQILRDNTVILFGDPNYLLPPDMQNPRHKVIYVHYIMYFKVILLLATTKNGRIITQAGWRLGLGGDWIYDDLGKPMAAINITLPNIQVKLTMLGRNPFSIFSSIFSIVWGSVYTYLHHILCFFLKQA